MQHCRKSLGSTGVSRVNAEGSTARSGRHFAAAALLGAVLAAVYAHADTKADGGDIDEAVAAVTALPADPAYGAYLAGECVTCHRATGGAEIPTIAGRPAGELVRALLEYRTGLRDNEVMKLMTSRLDDEEIAALAAHFSALPAE